MLLPFLGEDGNRVLFFFYRHVHGGAIATVLDSAMGSCVIFFGYRSFTANLNVDFIR
jgi:acyl-coenzyme A thioesterase PaaI-like protein